MGAKGSVEAAKHMHTDNWGNLEVGLTRHIQHFVFPYPQINGWTIVLVISCVCFDDNIGVCIYASVNNIKRW